MPHIEPIDHREPEAAAAIHALLVLAHAQEALLLPAAQRKALLRSAADIQAGAAFYLGAFAGDTLVGALSLGPDEEPGQLLVATLVVHPQQQRQGIAAALLAAALGRAPGEVFAVVTTALNAPALALYRGLGFQVYRRGALGDGGPELVKLRRPRAPLP